ncbi:lysis system i-spanin subunit Rz [Pseudomonas sp. B11(2017)]|uniref:lysis system i-spanin subunit Rz n=1 Tax=Pseudomonas sp. B11(2017) TaxID=1981748 RepID=UPI000A1FB22F|nr:lysis system i-spanin subunit Rz [Pseudomonas sp. B11(2017)]
MRLGELIPAPYRLLAMGVLLAIVAGGSAALAWQVQGWRYGERLAEQARLHSKVLNQLTLAAAGAQQAEQDKRLALEQRLSASEQTHYKELSDAQKDQARLRDRLATADLRLSVILDAGSAGARDVPKAAGASGVVHAGVRAELDPAFAQQIVAITDAGDRGLIALKACQGYIHALEQGSNAPPAGQK